jgi:hypothetical protein
MTPTAISATVALDHSAKSDMIDSPSKRYDSGTPALHVIAQG